jgi:hypothetical protein
LFTTGNPGIRAKQHGTQLTQQHCNTAAQAAQQHSNRATRAMSSRNNQAGAAGNRAMGNRQRMQPEQQEQQGNRAAERQEQPGNRRQQEETNGAAPQRIKKYSQISASSAGYKHDRCNRLHQHNNIATKSNQHSNIYEQQMQQRSNYKAQHHNKPRQPGFWNNRTANGRTTC